MTRPSRPSLARAPGASTALALGILLAAIVGGLATPAHAQTASAAAPIPPAVSDTGPRVVPDTLAERVTVCMTCHGPEGRATPYGYFPRIAGKPAGYLYHQLVAFRDGQRANPLMSGLVRHLSDDYLREMAGFFAAQDVPYPPPQPARLAPGVLERAAALVAHGDPSRQVPACTRCHGTAMTGVQPDIPGLLGLPRDYLVEQFGAWRNGVRHARAPDCMARVAKALSPEDVSAMANWLAAQPLPADPHAAAAIEQPLPFECGSVEKAGPDAAAAPAAGSTPR